MAPSPKPSKSTPATAAALASSSSSSLPPVLPTPSQSTSASIRQTRQRLERQLAEHEKLLQESNSGIGKNVLAGQISQIKDRLRDLDQQKQQQQQRRDDPLERLRSLEREYRSNSATTSTSSRTLDPIPSPSTPDLLSLPPAPTNSGTPTKRRSKVPNADRRNTDIEFATEIGQGLLIEVRKMQALLQQKEEQLSQLEIQKTDLERAVEAMAKQLRQREEIHEKLKEDTWNLEVAKQELTISVTELQQDLQKSSAEQARVVRQMNYLKAEMEKMRDREEKLTQQMETTKTRHEHDMGVMRRHGAQLQREKADQKKQIDALTSELAIAKAQSRIQKKSHIDLNHQNQQQAQLLLAGEAADNADPTDSNDSNTEPTNDPNTNDPPTGSPNKALEVETLKSSLAHAHRMVSNLRSNLHREKQEKFELKKLLAESQEAIEQMQNEDMWVDRATPQQQHPRRSSSTKLQKQKQRKAAGKHGKKHKRGVSRMGRSASASASNREDGDSTEYYDDDEDVLEESEYSSAGDEDLDEEEKMMRRMPPPQPMIMGLSLADQLKTATQFVSMATQTEQDNPAEMAAVTRATGEEIGVQTDTPVQAVVVVESKESSTQTDKIPVAKTEEVSTQTDIVEAEAEEPPVPKAEEISVQTEPILPPVLQNYCTQTEEERPLTQLQNNVPRQPIAVGQPISTQTEAVISVATTATRGEDIHVQTYPMIPAAVTTAITQTDDAVAEPAVTKGDTIGTQTAVVSGEEISTQTVVVNAEEISTQTDVIPPPVIATKEISTQTAIARSEEISTQTEEQEKRCFSAQADVAEPFTVMSGETFGVEAAMAVGKHAGDEALVLSSSSLASHQIHQAPTDRHSTDAHVMTSTVSPQHAVAPIRREPALSDGPMFITAQAVPQEHQHSAVATLSDATQAPSHSPPTMMTTPTGTGREATCWSTTSTAADEKGDVAQQQQEQSTTVSGFDLPTIPIVSITGFDSRPQSMTADSLVAGLPVGSTTAVAKEVGGSVTDVEMIPRAEADAMVAAAVQAALKPYLDNNKDDEEQRPQRPLNRPPSVLLSKATQRLSTMHGGGGVEEAPEFGTAYVSTQTMTYPTSQQQRHYHHQRRDSDSSASTAPTTDHRRPSFSSMQVNDAAQTANQHGISDPGVIALITQTMIGDWLWKYTRKAVGSGISERRHKRFFWIHPYTRTLYWSAHAPGVDGKESKAKSALIESITTIPEHSPLGAANVSMLIQTPGRQLRITAPDLEHHEVWYESLSYLMERAGASAGDHDSKKSSSSGVDPRYITPSLSTNSLLKKPSFPRLRPVRSISSFAGSVSSTNTAGSSSSRRMQQRGQPNILDDDDDDDDALEDVRMCCNGKHHVSKLEKDHHQHHHHHQHQRAVNSNPRRPPFHA